jgi:hypothetical protein
VIRVIAGFERQIKDKLSQIESQKEFNQLTR